MAVIRIVKSFSRNLRPITKSFWNVCPANGFKWNGRANKLSEFVQIPRRLRSVCPAGVTWGLWGGSDPPPLFLAAVESSHPIFSSGENVISGRGGRAQPWEEGASTPTGCSQPCQNFSKLSFILVIVAKLNISEDQRASGKYLIVSSALQISSEPCCLFCTNWNLSFSSLDTSVATTALGSLGSQRRQGFNA